MTVSSLLNYQFAWNGFLFGRGTNHYIESVDGLEGLPTIRSQDDDAGYSDGSFSGNDFLGGRTITFTITTLGSEDGTVSAHTNFKALRTALLPQSSGTAPLQFKLSSVTALQRINARVRSALIPLDRDFSNGIIRSQFTFFCPDPKFYDETLYTSVLAFSPPTGCSYNRTYPRLYGAGGGNTSYTAVVNAGWATSYPVITINGPITNPTIGNFTAGISISILGTFLATDVIVIDLASKLVTVNGVTARNLITGISKWFNAPAGTTQFYLTGSNTSPGVTGATIAYRSAYV